MSANNYLYVEQVLVNKCQNIHDANRNPFMQPIIFNNNYKPVMYLRTFGKMDLELVDDPIWTYWILTTSLLLPELQKNRYLSRISARICYKMTRNWIHVSMFIKNIQLKNLDNQKFVCTRPSK